MGSAKYKATVTMLSTPGLNQMSGDLLRNMLGIVVSESAGVAFGITHDLEL